MLRVVVALFAGGVRGGGAARLHPDEIRARDLGGPACGLVVTSIAFGAGHALRAGRRWRTGRARRRSGALVCLLPPQRHRAPMVSHAGFNSLEIVRYLVGGRRIVRADARLPVPPVSGRRMLISPRLLVLLFLVLLPAVTTRISRVRRGAVLRVLALDLVRSRRVVRERVPAFL